jgi:hypothetical protein
MSSILIGIALGLLVVVIVGSFIGIVSVIWDGMHLIFSGLRVIALSPEMPHGPSMSLQGAHKCLRGFLLMAGYCWLFAIIFPDLRAMGLAVGALAVALGTSCEFAIWHYLRSKFPIDQPGN